MSDGDLLYHAAQLEPEQWNNIPDSSQVGFSDSHDQSDLEQNTAYFKVISFLFNFMGEHLTARQFEVMRMYHLDYQLTQVAISQVLGITQPTVNQHLNGKKRDGKHVGGVYRRIRREVCRIAKSNDLPEDDRRILQFLVSLCQSDKPFKQRHRLI